MNKSDFINAITEKTDLSKASAAQVLDAVLETVTTSLKDGESVAFPGFGTFTVKERKRAAAGENRHVSGGELVEGFRQYALREFGPVARMVLQNWGLSGCEDIGAMVFHLIDERVFGKNDSDSPEDFAGHFTFAEAFEEPFQARPRGPVDTRS